MKKSKKFLALALATVMAASLTACGGKTDNKTSGSGSTPKSSQSASTGSQTASTGSNSGEKVKAELTVWSPQEDQSEESGNWLGKMCDDFAKAHPEWEITFKYGVCSESDATAKVGQDPTAAADVYMYSNDHVVALEAAKGISEFGGKVLDEIKASNSPTILDSVTYKDGVYGVPFTSNTWFMYYDKRVFTEDDVKSLDKMLEKGKVSFPLSNSWYFAAFYVANGNVFYGGNNDESAGIDFGGDKAVAVTKYLVNLVKNPNFTNDADGSGIAGLADGSVNAVFSGTWDYQNVVDKLGEENVGATQLPTIMIDGQEKQLRSFAGSKAIAVNPNTKNPEIAVALAAFLGSAASQKEHYKLRKIIPSHVELLKDAEVMSDIIANAQASTVANTSIMQPFGPEMNANYWGNAENMGKAIINGDVTEENAAEKTEAFNNSLNGR